MKTKDWQYWAMVATGGITFLSGIVQMLMPKVLLSGLSAENTRTSRHFFGTVGMFMTIVGGALFQGLRNHSDSQVLVFWTALQKLGASIAVGLGVKRGVFSPLALFIAGFDFLSGLLAMSYWLRIARVRMPVPEKRSTVGMNNASHHAASPPKKTLTGISK